jgi:hypothetical protein
MVQLVMLSPETYTHCFVELQKVAKADIAALLTRKALKKGVNPEGLGAIQQVKRIASGGPDDRKRAAQIANRVRGYLRQKAA